MQAKDTRALNKAVVGKFLNTFPGMDWAAMGETLAEDMTLHFQRPTMTTDSGESKRFIQGRDRLLKELGTYISQIFRPGSVRVTVESIIAEDDMVGARFILAATTVRRNEAYENFYYFHFRLKDGKITDCWEYLDNHYAIKMLFS